MQDGIYDPFHDEAGASDPRAVKKKAEQEKRNFERDLDDMRNIVATKSGRRFVWKHLSECKIFQSSFDGSSKTYFNEGERNVGLKILARLNDAAPEAYVTMIKESKGGEYDV